MPRILIACNLTRNSNLLFRYSPQIGMWNDLSIVLLFTQRFVSDTHQYTYFIFLCDVFS